MRGKRIAKIVIALAIVGIGYAVFKDDIAKTWQNLHVKIVEHPTPKKTVWLDQGISKEKLSWFYHADQGTRTFGFPYKWFMALEQPTIPWLLFTSPGLFSDPAYLDRYGFIADTIIPGKTALPIGFAEGTPMLDPTGATLSVAALVALVYGIIQAPEQGWTDPLILAAFGEVLVLVDRQREIWVAGHSACSWFEGT